MYLGYSVPHVRCFFCSGTSEALSFPCNYFLSCGLGGQSVPCSAHYLLLQRMQGTHSRHNLFFFVLIQAGTRCPTMHVLLVRAHIFVGCGTAHAKTQCPMQPIFYSLWCTQSTQCPRSNNLSVAKYAGYSVPGAVDYHYHFVQAGHPVPRSMHAISSTCSQCVDYEVPMISNVSPLYDVSSSGTLFPGLLT